MTVPPPVPAPRRAGRRTARLVDIAEAASWARGVERTGPRQLRYRGDDPLAMFRSFCASILLTRTVAETV